MVAVRGPLTEALECGRQFVMRRVVILVCAALGMMVLVVPMASSYETWYPATEAGVIEVKEIPAAKLMVVIATAICRQPARS
jgi:hypothetical protein